MNNFAHLTTDDVVDFGQGGGIPVPPGRYTAHLVDIHPIDVDGKPSSVKADFEVLDQDNMGAIVEIKYFPTASISPKDGRVFARGISEMKAACATIKRPLSAVSLSEYAKTDTQIGCTPRGARHLAREMGSRFTQDLRIQLEVYLEQLQQKNPVTNKYEDAVNDDGTPKMVRRARVVGLAPGQASAASADEVLASL